MVTSLLALPLAMPSSIQAVGEGKLGAIGSCGELVYWFLGKMVMVGEMAVQKEARVTSSS